MKEAKLDRTVTISVTCPECKSLVDVTFTSDKTSIHVYCPRCESDFDAVFEVQDNPYLKLLTVHQD